MSIGLKIVFSYFRLIMIFQSYVLLLLISKRNAVRKKITPRHLKIVNCYGNRQLAIVYAKNIYLVFVAIKRVTFRLNFSKVFKNKMCRTICECTTKKV